mmetsp:Transcript_72343/g.143615  ORF Transcript_72343/g.143615 Transcript_72343/m.143615 type:complete len:231 (-) Transcript_72343:313-1005(-)
MSTGNAAAAAAAVEAADRGRPAEAVVWLWGIAFSRRADHSKGGATREGQQLSLILEEHGGSRGEVHCQCIMRGRGGVGVRPSARLGAVHDPLRKHGCEYVCSHIGDGCAGEAAVADGGSELVGGEEATARHLHVEAGARCGGSRLRRAPVGHDPASEVKLASQQLERPGVLTRPYVVHPIVPAHNRSDPGVHRRGKGRHVDLHEGALVDVGRHVPSVVLLVVEYEVLGRR